MKIEGRNAVLEAIKSGNTIDKLLVQNGQKDANAQKIINEAKARDVKIFFREKNAMDRESVTNRHQGFIAHITDFSYCTIDDILEKAQKDGKPPLVLVLDGIEDPHNLGSIIRVAECAGVTGIVIPRHRAVSVNETVIKVSAGASAHVLIAKETNVNDSIDYLKKQGLFVYGSKADGENMYNVNFSQNKGGIALVIGGESTGIKQLTLKKCDAILSIPMFGKLNSLNASVATGIILYQIIKN